MWKKHIGKNYHGRVRITCQNNLSFADACVSWQPKGGKSHIPVITKHANKEKATFWWLWKRHIGKKKHGRVRITCQNNLSFADACVSWQPKGRKSHIPVITKHANNEISTFWCLWKIHIGKKKDGRVRIPCQNNLSFADACVSWQPKGGISYRPVRNKYANNKKVTLRCVWKRHIGKKNNCRVVITCINNL